MSVAEDKTNSYMSIFRECREFCDTENFGHFLITESSGEENLFSSRTALMSDIPASLFHLCEDIQLLNTQQPMHRGDETIGFMFWDHLEVRFEKDAQLLIEDIGLTHAIGVPLPVKEGPGTALFFGAKDIGEKNNIVEISNWAGSLSRRLRDIEEKGRNSAVRISKRERECLLWTSQGKTSYEIGMILGLSENTINNYLATVGRKLGAFNRPHMVGLALRNGYIE